MNNEDKNQDKVRTGTNPANAEAQVTDGAHQSVISQDAKMGPGANNTLANNPNQTETPGMQGKKDQDSSSSESLADSEMSAGEGAIEGEEEKQENKEADPRLGQAPTRPAGEEATDQAAGSTPSGEAYGGNFSNSTQASYRDHDRRENQLGGAARGEFGSQDSGNTQGGYGNQYRETDVAGESNEGNERYYSGSNYNPGPQHNSYRDFDGRRDTYDQPAPAGTAQLQQQPGSAQTEGNAPSATGPDRDSQGQRFQNDNGSGYGPDSGFSEDYGRSSLAPGSEVAEQGEPHRDLRNQSDDQTASTRGEYDPESGPENLGQRQNQEKTYGQGAYQDHDPKGSYDAPSERDEHESEHERSGYRGGSGDHGGSADQGFGSQGGSYNDEYNSANPSDPAGSPSRGDYDQADKAQNYGQEKREDFRSDSADSEQVDYGAAPRRNQGRDDDQA